MDATQDAVLDWMMTGEIGSSSQVMAFWLAFGKRATGAT